MGGQSRIGIIIGNWKVEIRGEVVWSGESWGTVILRCTRAMSLRRH